MRNTSIIMWLGEPPAVPRVGEDGSVDGKSGFIAKNIAEDK